MFSALKKLVGSDQAAVRDKNIPAGLQSMNQALQRRFAKGVQYNSESRPGAPGAAFAPVIAALPCRGLQQLCGSVLGRAGGCELRAACGGCGEAVSLWHRAEFFVNGLLSLQACGNNSPGHVGALPRSTVSLLNITHNTPVVM